uniref:Putative transmembrane and ubiquitin-like domain-containing protein 2 n=1 Tax=Ixodes ricinus TaxID=34613 RepID=A0A131Y8N4_IXORI
MSEAGSTFIEGVGDEVVLFTSISLTFAVLAVTALYFQYAFQTGQRPRREQPSPTQNRQQQSDGQGVPNQNGNSSLPTQATLARASPEPTRSGPASSKPNGAPKCGGTSRSATADCAVGQTTKGEAGDVEEVPEHSDALRQRRLEFYERREHSESPGSSLADEAERVPEPLPGDAEVEPDEEEVQEEDGVAIRLKYLNDTERCVRGRLDETVGAFKRRHFAPELADQRLVRLIFNGGQLREDGATLSSCGLCEGCVVHVHISTTPVPPGDSPSASGNEGDLNLSGLMWPLFAAILGILWVLHFQYQELFNTSTTVVLVGISGLFCVGLYGQHYPQSPPQTDQARPNPLPTR